MIMISCPLVLRFTPSDKVLCKVRGYMNLPVRTRTLLHYDAGRTLVETTLQVPGTHLPRVSRCSGSPGISRMHKVMKAAR